MFNRVRVRLVLLNAAVILLILSVLSSLVYFHMRYSLFYDSDEFILLAKNRLQANADWSELLQPGRQEPHQDETDSFLFWDSQGELVAQIPTGSFPEGKASGFFSKKDLGGDASYTVKVGNERYNVLQFPNNEHAPQSIAYVSIVRSLKDADATLRALLWDIAFSIAAGLVISVIAGLFLANRALIPIRQAWERQQRFVADASHELRTPTTVIHAQTEMMLHHPTHTIEQEGRSIASILRESKRMKRLLDDLLTLARNDSNQQQLDVATISLNELLLELAEQFRLLAVLKQIEIVTVLEGQLSMRGEETRIRQLLVILLDNALKFSQPSDRITLIGRTHANTVLITVQDTGIGIPEGDLPHIFDRFYRGDKARSRADGGTGLGLSIAQWIVQAHGGDIRVESKLKSGTKVDLIFKR